MKAYSEDLRRKIIETYEKEGGSLRELAKRFNVALSFVIKLRKQYKETGALKPKEYTRGPATKLTQNDLQQLKQLVEEKNDATLNELMENLNNKRKIHVSISTISRGLRKLGLTRKKRHYTLKKEIVKESK